MSDHRIFERYQAAEQALAFVKESNRIEGILRPPTEAEMAEYWRFMALKDVTIGELEKFLSVYQPDARLRQYTGMDVRVGYYLPPSGGIAIKTRLEDICANATTGRQYPETGFTPYEIHHHYEKLHPFTDGNGRSGRMLWMWMMKKAPLGFLHTWYYQSLQYAE